MREARQARGRVKGDARRQPVAARNRNAPTEVVRTKTGDIASPRPSYTDQFGLRMLRHLTDCVPQILYQHQKVNTRPADQRPTLR